MPQDCCLPTSSCHIFACRSLQTKWALELYHCLGMLEFEALHLFDELSELKLLPNIVTFGATVTACEKGAVLHVHRLMSCETLH